MLEEVYTLKMKNLDKEKELDQLKKKLHQLEQTKFEREISHEVQKNVLKISTNSVSTLSKSLNQMPLFVEQTSTYDLSPPQSPISKFAPLPPPPPPPPMLNEASKSKKIPKSSQTMKTVNWTKLPYNACLGTVWEKLNEEEAFKLIDINDLQEKFSIKEMARNASRNENNAISAKTKTLPSVLENNRAQLCEMFLKGKNKQTTTPKPTKKEIFRKIYSIDITNIDSLFTDQLVNFLVRKFHKLSKTAPWHKNYLFFSILKKDKSLLCHGAVFESLL
jgi:hypothetical protein